MVAINLSKGQRVTLDNSMTMAFADLGLDTNQYDGEFDFDLEVSVFLLGKAGKCSRDEDFIFYGSLLSRNGAVVQQGDHRVGGDDGEKTELRTVA